MIVGAGGKMGPSLARLAKRAIDRAGLNYKVIAVVRKDRDGLGPLLRSEGIDLLEADLMEADSVQQLPDAGNIVFMAGRKFGTSTDQPLTRRPMPRPPASQPTVFVNSALSFSLPATYILWSR